MVKKRNVRGKLFSLCSIFILRSASYLTLIVSLRAPLPISRSPSHFTLCFSFHAPLPISHSASHFTLPFSFHAPLLISRPLLIFHTWNGRHHLTKTSAVVMWFAVFCSVLQKYLGEHFSSVVRVIDINYC